MLYFAYNLKANIFENVWKTYQRQIFFSLLRRKIIEFKLFLYFDENQLQKPKNKENKYINK